MIADSRQSTAPTARVFAPFEELLDSAWTELGVVFGCSELPFDSRWRPSPCLPGFNPAIFHLSFGFVSFPCSFWRCTAFATGQLRV